MKIIQIIIDLIISLLGIKRDNPKNEIIFIEPDKEDVIKQIKKANAERLQKALDYATSLVYYKRGYENKKYPEIVRTYEFKQIPITEYKRLKKKPGSVHLVTYCNVLARKIARGCFDYGLYDNRRDPEYNWMNWDLKAGFPDYSYHKIFYGMTPKHAMQLALNAVKRNSIKKLLPREAQERANNGVYIWGVSAGHEVVIYPDLENEYDENKGPKIAQAGWYNISNIYISDSKCWGENWKTKGIHFFEFPYENKGFIEYLDFLE